MAASDRNIQRLIHAITATVAALVILAPTLDGWLTDTAAITPQAPLEGTQTLVLPSTQGPSAGLRPGAIETLPALVDASARTLMQEQHAPGTAVAIVYGGAVVALRAYGLARVETNTPVDASRTLFRVGSVTKPLTAAAVLQLVDDGRLDLFRDVREYLPGLDLPYRVTTHQLLTHTAGFDVKFAGNFTRSPDALEALAPYLRRSIRAANQPGLFYSYSSSNYAVAGWLLEQVSGLPYDDAMSARLFTPLEMTATTTRQPPEAAILEGRAPGYEWDGAQYQRLPYRYTNTGPAGALSTTAADMGRFMLAMLGDGSRNGVRVLSPASRAKFLRPQFRDHPRLPGVTYGFHEWRTHGRTLLHHDGTLDDQVGVLLLDPDAGFGMFAASNSNPGIGNHLLAPVLDHLYGPEAPPSPGAPRGTGHAKEVAGVYLDTNRTRHDLSSVRALMPMLQARVVADGDAIVFAGRRWVEVEPFVFQAPGAGEPIVFRGPGARVLQTWNSTYQRLEWTQQPLAQLGLAGSCLLVFLGFAAGSARRWRRWRDGRAARACALFVAVANVAFVVWLVVSLRRLGATTPLPVLDVLFLSLGVAAAMVATLLPGFAVAASRGGWWTRGARTAFTVLSVSAVAFAAWLNAWNLLGFRC
jgi:CubicO group peptidase (beta-lactamase class C family)